jgi:hypothetical protein
MAETQPQGGISSVGQSVLLVALKALIWHTDHTFRGREKGGFFRHKGLWGKLNKHKGLS